MGERPPSSPRRRGRSQVSVTQRLHLSVQLLVLGVDVDEVRLRGPSSLHFHHEELPERDDLGEARQHQFHQLLVFTLLHQLRTSYGTFILSFHTASPAADIIHLLDTQFLHCLTSCSHTDVGELRNTFKMSHQTAFYVK